MVVGSMSVFLVNSQIDVQYRPITPRFIVKHIQWALIHYHNCLIEIWFWCFSAKRKRKKIKIKFHAWFEGWEWNATQFCLLVDRLHSLWEVLSVIGEELSNNKNPYIFNIRLYAGIIHLVVLLYKNTCFCREGGGKVSKNIAIKSAHNFVFSESSSCSNIKLHVLLQHSNYSAHTLGMA